MKKSSTDAQGKKKFFWDDTNAKKEMFFLSHFLTFLKTIQDLFLELPILKNIEGLGNSSISSLTIFIVLLK